MNQRALLPAFFLFLWSVASAYADNTIVIGGSGADLETFRILAKAFKRHHPNSEIKVLPSIGSGGAVRGVSTGRVDIGLLARPLSEQERKLGLAVIHYANTALIFVTKPGHPAKNINTATLKAIYRGENVGYELIPILRSKTDSDTLLLQERMPEISPAMAVAYERKGIPVGMTDQSTMEMLLHTENTITTSTLALVTSEGRPVQILSLNGVKPSPENSADGSYPLLKKLFVMHDGLLTDTENRFLEFVRSEEGQDILKQTGHEPVR